LRTADESVRKAAETWKTATEMIYKLDDTMTQEEENLCERANNLRRRSEVTFKTVDATKKIAARRVHSYGDPDMMPKTCLQFEVEPEDMDIFTKREVHLRRRKSSISLDDNFLSQVTEESVIEAINVSKL